MAKAVCRISVGSIKELILIEDRKKLRSLKKKARLENARVYDYTAELFARELSVIRIEDGDGISYVRFSPDGELIKLLNKSS